MSKIKKFIPDEIFIATQQETEWSDEVSDKKIKAKSAFAVDASNEKRVETATTWAKRNYYGGKELPHELITEKNEPFCLSVMGYELRKGSDVIKVYDDNMRVYDMRLYAFVNTIAEIGMNSGGKFSGKFIWASHEGNWQPIPFGGKIHKKILDMDTQREEGFDLVKYGVYGTAKKTFIYLGDYEIPKRKEEELAVMFREGKIISENPKYYDRAYRYAINESRFIVKADEITGESVNKVVGEFAMVWYYRKDYGVEIAYSAKELLEKVKVAPPQDWIRFQQYSGTKNISLFCDTSLYYENSPEKFKLYGGALDKKKLVKKPEKTWVKKEISKELKDRIIEQVNEKLAGKGIDCVEFYELSKAKEIKK